MAAGAKQIRTASVGERWVLRRRLPDGSATDVVGWLTALGSEQVVVDDPDGGEQVVAVADLVAARRAPVARGGPHPRRVPVEVVQAHAVRGWLAHHEPLGEWTLRAGGGFTGRANSAHAVGDPQLPLAEAAQRVIAYADRHGIKPMAQVVLDSAADRGLTALGWGETYETTQVLVIGLVTLLADRPRDPAVAVLDELTPAWLAAYQRSRPTSADPNILRMILDGQPPRAFGQIIGAGGALVGIGRGHLSDDWLGIASMWTDPAHRRRGLATAVLTGLAHWGARQGARYAYLQVAEANRSAQLAYEQLGFVTHHTYRYLAPPSGEAQTQMTRSVGA